MAPNSILSLIVTVFIFVLANAELSLSKGGGWEPILNPSGLYVTEIGKFAIDKHNKLAKNSLVFLNVTSGDFLQAVDGWHYKLQIYAKGSNRDLQAQIYEAVVWDKPWEIFRLLISFCQKVNKSLCVYRYVVRRQI